jgi:hypothetical protein
LATCSPTPRWICRSCRPSVEIGWRSTPKLPCQVCGVQCLLPFLIPEEACSEHFADHLAHRPPARIDPSGLDPTQHSGLDRSHLIPNRRARLARHAGEERRSHRREHCPRLAPAIATMAGETLSLDPPKAGPRLDAIAVREVVPATPAWDLVVRALPRAVATYAGAGLSPGQLGSNDSGRCDRPPIHDRSLIGSAGDRQGSSSAKVTRDALGW